MKRLLVAAFAAVLACGPATSADDHSRKKSAKKTKVETGASCKAPAVGPCSSCAITCRPGETAICAPAQISADMCIVQSSCKCIVR